MYVEVVEPTPIMKATPTPVPAPTEIPEPENPEQEDIPFLIKIKPYLPVMFSVTVASGGAGGYLWFLLLLRKKRTFHGIFDEKGIPGTKIKGVLDADQRKLWDVAGAMQELNSGKLSVSEYVERVSSMTSYTVFPSDTKMMIHTGELKLTVKATEAELFRVLSEAQGKVKAVLTSKRTGMVVELDFIIKQQ